MEHEFQLVFIARKKQSIIARSMVLDIWTFFLFCIFSFFFLFLKKEVRLMRIELTNLWADASKKSGGTRLVTQRSLDRVFEKPATMQQKNGDGNANCKSRRKGTRKMKQHVQLTKQISIEAFRRGLILINGGTYAVEKSSGRIKLPP